MMRFVVMLVAYFAVFFGLSVLSNTFGWTLADVWKYALNACAAVLVFSVFERVWPTHSE